MGDIEHTPDGRLLLEVEGRYGSAGPGLAIGLFSVWVELLLREGKFVTYPPGGEAEVASWVALTEPGGSSLEEPAPNPVLPSVSLLFPLPDAALPSKGPSTGGALVTSAATYRQLADFYAAAEGDPFYASGRWFRMLYLSAVTLTTLGFGDITPVSNAARLWVAIEAVSGVVVVGLFLNALAQLMRRRENQPSPLGEGEQRA